MSKCDHTIEESLIFQPNFINNLMPVVVIDSNNREILMLAYVNLEAINKTLSTGLAHYFSRSRNKIWQKGEESGYVQKVKQIRVDCDQDALVYEVEQIGGASCHTGRVSCFYRKLALNSKNEKELKFSNKKRIFDPVKIYSTK